MKSIYKPPLQIANPAWSPDGKRIAFIGGLMSDEPSVGGDIFTIPATGGEANNITPDESLRQLARVDSRHKNYFRRISRRRFRLATSIR